MFGTVPGYRLIDTTLAGHDLGACAACGALVATSDPVSVEQHNHWHAAHPGPPPVQPPQARPA